MDARPVRAFHNDPFRPVLYNSKSLEVSDEQMKLIDEVLVTSSSDTRFAKKASDAIKVILTAGSVAPPTISSLSPVSAPVLSASVPVTVTGTGFDEGSVILVNGNELPTNRTSDTAVDATLDLAAVTDPVQYPVVVRSGSGALSNTAVFDVTAAVLQQKKQEKENAIRSSQR